MQYSALFVAGLIGQAAAFPRAFNAEALEKSKQLVERQDDALGISKAQTNCGPTPCLVCFHDLNS